MADRRISVPIPQELYEKFHRVIPWGFRKHLMKSVVEIVLEAVERDGNIVMGAVMAGRFRLQWEPDATDGAQNLSKDSENDIQL